MKTKRPPGRPRAEVKPQQFSVRLHAGDYAALEQMAAIYGLSLSGAVERAVRVAAAQITPAQRKALAALQRAREEV